MGGFLFTPMTRFYAEALQYMKNAGGRTTGKVPGVWVDQTGLPGNGQAGAGNVINTAGTDMAGSFAGTVQEQLAKKEQGAAGALRDSYGQETDGVIGMMSGKGQAGGRDEQAVQAMSMEQYKFYIYQKISNLPTSPTQKWDAVSVNISEEGFAAMKSDPAYENGGWIRCGRILPLTIRGALTRAAVIGCIISAPRGRNTVARVFKWDLETAGNTRIPPRKRSRKVSGRSGQSGISSIWIWPQRLGINGRTSGNIRRRLILAGRK